MPGTVKVAVIGSGLAGLTAAHHLTEQSGGEHGVTFEIHLFEKSSSLGMDVSSISLPIPGSHQDWRIDVPMRSFQGGYYPNLIKFYKQLGVAIRTSNYSYSFSLLRSTTNTLGREITASTIYNGYSGLAGVGMPSHIKMLYSRCKAYSIPVRLIAGVWSLALYAFLAVGLLICYLRLVLLSAPFSRPANIETMPFHDWIAKSTPRGLFARWTACDRLWLDFTHYVLLPLFSAVCTAPEEDVLNYPAEEFLDYIWLTLGTHHYVAVKGVRDVVSKLTYNLPASSIHLSSTVLSIERDSGHPSQASIRCTEPDGNKTYEGFDHIILATEAINSVPILASFAHALPLKSPKRQFVDKQIECLQKFQYASTIVINHTDDTLLPDSVSDRRDLNLIYTDSYFDQDKASGNGKEFSKKLPCSYTMATHILPRPPNFPKHLPTIFQTTNPTIEPREGCILSVARLERGIVTIESKLARNDLYVRAPTRWLTKEDEGKLGRLQGRGSDDDVGFWICGSYAYPGIPLLEGCVVTGRAVVMQGILESERRKRCT